LSALWRGTWRRCSIPARGAPSSSGTISALQVALSSRCASISTPGFVAPRHTHPGEEIIYVLEGALEYQIGDKPVTVKPGDVLFVPAGTVHSVKNIGSGNGAELATYVVEKGKPLIEPVP
jgi:mannose-6-phosphate isomerase-like protein (cupin superfamily)